MDLILQDEIRELMRKRSDSCVSLYLPTHKTGRDTLQDPIRLDNLLRGAEKELVAGGVRASEARELLQPAQDFLKEATTTRRLTDGLSMFISRNFFKYFKLPLRFYERLHIGRQFYLKPLAPLLHGDKKFFILAVSQKSLRLFECTEFGANEIELQGVPRSMREALGTEEESIPLFRMSSQASNPGTAQMVHGHGGAAESEKDRLRRWFQILKDSLHPVFRQEKIPLVFAGVEYLFPMFKQAEIYRNIPGEFIEGNPDELDSLELHKKGLRLISAYFNREKEQAIDRCSELLGGPLASESIADILPGADSGRVDTLFVDTDAQQWGKYDPASGNVEVHSERQTGDEDLLDLAFANAYLSGATVYGLSSPEMPGKDAAAIFRY
ncbi:MAG: hypothetical protein ACP5SH_02535 [Syntrophobacteraceae bacterium]